MHLFALWMSGVQKRSRVCLNTDADHLEGVIIPRKAQPQRHKTAKDPQIPKQKADEQHTKKATAKAIIQPRGEN